MRLRLSAYYVESRVEYVEYVECSHVLSAQSIALTHGGPLLTTSSV